MLFRKLEEMKEDVTVSRKWFNIAEISILPSRFVDPMNIQVWFLLGLTGCISLQCKIFERTPRSLLLVALTCSVWFIWAPYKVTNGLLLLPALATTMKVIVRVCWDLFSFNFQTSKKPGVIGLFFMVSSLWYIAKIPSFVNYQHCYVFYLWYL